jgi:hypothetical protein
MLSPTREAETEPRELVMIFTHRIESSKDLQFVADEARIPGAATLLD